ncbi:MAG: glycosyl hydrolase family 28-related protein, partial [Planctomycetota bacterium]|nr:glycosyl hydrolase family 28-related protein [Planctomycetota bacterium]
MRPVANAMVAHTLILWLVSVGLGAAEIWFPPDAEVIDVVIDVVRDLGIDNTGQSDVTEPLAKLYREAGRQLQVIYFPKGTYLVSGMIQGKHDQSRKGSSHSHGPWLIGESRTETVIRLADGTWPEDSFPAGTIDTQALPKRIDERAVLHTGDCTNTTFNQVIRNLTVNTGRNNAGATGIVFIASNTGSLAEVDIVSEDGQGSVGLALCGTENGPAQVRDLRVRGFRRGMYAASHYFMTVSRVTIEDATEWGILNRGDLLLEDLRMTVAPGAGGLANCSRWADLAALGLKIVGAAPQRGAIENEGRVYLREVRTEGFAQALSNRPHRKLADKTPPAPAGASIDAYASQPASALFGEPGQALDVPRVYPSYPSWDADPDHWDNPVRHKTPDGSWSDALRASLAATGKTHLVIPFGQKVSVRGAFTLGGDYRRVVGTLGQVVPEDDDTTLVIADGSAPVVVLEGISCPTIVIDTDRTVILDSVRPRR